MFGQRGARDQRNGTHRHEGKNVKRMDHCTNKEYWPDGGRSKKIVQVALFVCTVLLRWHNIGVPERACWDESFFVQMSGCYLTRTLFFDLHPPLGKLLIAATGRLFGFDGISSFEDPPVYDYHKETPYVGMRMVCSFVGSLIIPLSFETVWVMTGSMVAAALSGTLLMLDSGMIALTRLIILDPWLMTGISLTVFAVTKFEACSERPFNKKWWSWLTFTGVSIGYVLSVKFIGLFVMAYVGIRTVADLWTLITDRIVSLGNTAKHFLARFVALLCIPLIIYVAIFYVHFTLLNKSGGDTDGFYTPAFQAHLEGNPLGIPRPAHVTYGSTVTIRNHRLGGRYLHYSLGAQRKQMPRDLLLTTFQARGINNHWTLRQVELLGIDEPILVKSNDSLVLDHVINQRMIVRNEGGLLTRNDKFVSCTDPASGNEQSTHFVFRALNKSAGATIDTTTTVFQIVNKKYNCVLKSPNGLIPGWLKEHKEVTCTDDHTDKDSYWMIEEVFDDRLPKTIIKTQHPGFLTSFIEGNYLLLEGNAGLVMSADEMFKTSPPWQWPLNYKGQHFSLYGGFRVYLLGNPVIWWSNLATLIVFPLFYGVHKIRQMRGHRDFPNEAAMIEKTFTSCWWLFLCWSLHYLPFFIIGRLTYVHHYYPAFVFNSMLTGIFLDLLFQLMTRTVAPGHAVSTMYHCTVGAALSIILYSFYKFLPLAYGIEGPTAGNVNSKTTDIQWLKSWEI